MPIAVKTAAALLAIFLALFAGAWIILQSAVMPGFERLEVRFHERDKARVEANLSALTNDMQARTLDYAQWDDTYRYVTGRYPSYPSVNFSDDWFANYGVDLLAFADDDGRILWTDAVGEDGAMRPDPAAVNAALSETLAAPASEAPLVGVVWTERGPLLFAAMRARPSDGAGAPRGVVILGKRLSQGVLSEQVQLDLRLINTAAPPSGLAEHMAALQTAESHTWTTRDALQSLIALRDARGGLVGAILAERPRDITALGGRSIAVALLLFAAMSALTLAALWFLLRRVVISRIQKLERHFNAHADATELLAHAAPLSSDEIGRLTAAYNALVLRVGEANAREQAAVLQRETAAAADRMKSDFLANISHELRTPLTAVIGYSELIEEDLADAGVRHVDRDLQRIRGAARHLLSLINEILDLSKIEAGKLETTPGSFQVEEMLRGVVELTDPLLVQTGNTLSLDFAPNLGAAYSDEMRLRQSLVNLISNACRFTRNGAISLSAKRCRDGDHDTLRFEVRDNGAGMSDAQLARVFQPFIQAESAIARKFGGTGLGLAITRKVVELLGGALEASSVVGQGSTFALIVPAIVSEPSAAPEQRDDKKAAVAA